MEINKKFYRHAEVELLYADNSLACKELEWQPKNSFDDLVRRMVQNDI
jgi:GDPmannose 4,6-dehydratase